MAVFVTVRQASGERAISHLGDAISCRSWLRGEAWNAAARYSALFHLPPLYFLHRALRP